MSKFETVPAEDWDDSIPLLDDELNRLPERYRAALVACELEGKSRRVAAVQLGLSEGTLSTHLARGRKMLRERLQRRGVSLGIGPAAALRPRGALAMISERLMDSTVQASLGFASRSGAAGPARAAVASLAERVLKTMLLTKLSLCLAPVSAVVCVLSLVTLLAAGSLTADPAKVGPDDLAGRIIDEAGTVVADGQVWAVVGPWGERVTIAQAKTDGRGRFILPKAWDHEAAKAAIAAGQFGLFGRAPDGRTGWVAKVDRSTVGTNNTLDIAVGDVGEARGRVTDQNGRPIAGATITPLMINRVDNSGSDLSFNLPTELIDSYRTATAKDGSFVLKDTPRGARVRAAIEAPGIGWLHFLWDSTHPMTFTFDDRPGQIKGRIKLTDGGSLLGPISVRARLEGSPAAPGAHSLQAYFHRSVTAANDGSFLLDHLPPGRYFVEFDINQNPPIEGKRVENVEVRPGSTVAVEIPAERLLTITGRVVDTTTGRGLAAVPIHCFRLNETWYFKDSREAKTDADGRFSLATLPGVVKIMPAGSPRAGLVASRSGESPDMEIMTDQIWPDLNLVRAVEVDGIVVDQTGQPVVGADVYMLDGGPLRQDEMTRTGPGGTFHLKEVDPDAPLSLWARTMVSSTDGSVTVRPKDLAGRLTLTVDPKFACQIRGVATDANGNRVPGANVKLWWNRPYAQLGNQTGTCSVSVLQSYVTGKNGWFVFRGLWPGCEYGAEVEAWGHTRGNMFTIKGEPGETYDAGKFSVINTIKRLRGRVVGSDGHPVKSAVVVSRGDSRETVQTITDQEGRFQLGPLAPEQEHVFIRKDGYRFTGVKLADDGDDVAVTMLKQTEPAPAWKPASAAGFGQERAFATRALMRLWDKYGAEANEKDQLECILAMASIDPALASEWAAARGHQNHSRVRQPIAEALAEQSVEDALEFLAKNRDSQTQSFLLKLAHRFVGRDRAKALRFADEAQARIAELGEAERPTALAATGAVLARAGRAEAGRALVDEAARAAARLGLGKSDAQARAIVAGAIAPSDLKQALALVKPIRSEDKDRSIAFVARAIARTDTAQAVALADLMDGPLPVRERVKTAIAYKIGADRPDEAIKIIESIKGDDAARWQAEAFGWLAVAIAPRNQPRAFALIERALDMITDDCITAETSTGYEMLAAAHVAARAHQIAYPDMESVVMRVVFARPANWRGDPFTKLRFVSLATIGLALLDPDVARIALEQTEFDCGVVGLKPAGFPDDRGRWLTAVALADLKKAETLFESELAALDGINEPDLWFQGIVNTAKHLATPPQFREVALQNGFYAKSWHPGSQRP